ncbi:MAG: acyltransferase family protein, partial [Chthoniobacterales bacterium]
MTASPGTPRPYLSGHAALRGLAAIAVFLAHLEITHLWPPGPETFWTAAYDRLFFWHGEGVDLFFVLSGFILFYVHPPRQNGIWRDYFTARIGKIYPFYLAATLFTAAMFVIGSLRKHEPPFSNLELSVFLANLAGVQQWTFAGDNWNSINLPSWSISVELLLYITAWPLLRLLFRACPVNRLVALGICVGLLAAASWIHVYAADGTERLLASPMSLLRGFVCFTAGAFLYMALY